MAFQRGDRKPRFRQVACVSDTAPHGRCSENGSSQFIKHHPGQLPTKPTKPHGPPNGPKPNALVKNASGPIPVSTPYSCTELMEALKSIQKVIECCSCHKPLHSARTCTTGHALCWNCKNRCNNLCPLCNTRVMDSKPIMLNSIIKLLPRQCNFSENGCDSLVLANDNDHEAFCRFRRITCRIPSCDTQCLAKDLLRHIEDFHGKELIRHAEHYSILMAFDAKIEKNGITIIVAFNNIIWQHTKVGNNRLLQFYQYVPMEKPKAKFTAEIHFYTPEVSFIGSTPVHTDGFDPARLFKDKDTFCLPRKYAVSFNHFYSGVHYNFKIVKVDL